MPVLVLDVTEEEADKLLLTFDPLSAMAKRDVEKFAALAESVSPKHPTVRKMIADMQAVAATESPQMQRMRDAIDVPESFAVFIDCDNETHQQAIYQRLTSEGLECRLVTL